MNILTMVNCTYIAKWLLYAQYHFKLLATTRNSVCKTQCSTTIRQRALKKKKTNHLGYYEKYIKYAFTLGFVKDTNKSFSDSLLL